MEEIRLQRDEVVDALTNPGIIKDHEQMCRLVGVIEGLDYLLNIAYEDMEEDYAVH